MIKNEDVVKMQLKPISRKGIRAVAILYVLLFIFGTPITAYAAYETNPGGIKYHDMNIPVYDGDGYEVIHGNDPEFDPSEKTLSPFERYSELDSLGRCGEAYANVCKETMPAEGETRGAIGKIFPSGWINVKYGTELIPGGYLYNRSHLIGWQLTAENANPKNLITGTRSFNDPIMLRFENQVAKYVKETDHHVLYRVTPVFDGNNLLADGVIMEAESVEDNQIEFCVFCYNVQKGIEIDYATGASRLEQDASGKTDIAKCQISVSPSKYTYTGSALKPRVQIENVGTPLNESDYSVTYKNNINAGTADVIITGKGDYSGSVTKHFTINPRSILSSKANAADMYYTGKAVTPEINATYNDLMLVSGEDFLAEYSDNIKLGTGKAVLKGQGNYTGSKTVSFKIKMAPPKIKKVKAGSKKLTITWTKVKGSKGYQLQYRLKNKKYKTLQIKNAKTFKKTISKLKKKKVYQVRIRAYSKVGNKKVYSEYSETFTKKTR